MLVLSLSKPVRLGFVQYFVMSVALAEYFLFVCLFPVLLVCCKMVYVVFDFAALGIRIILRSRKIFYANPHSTYFPCKTAFSGNQICYCCLKLGRW